VKGRIWRITFAGDPKTTGLEAAPTPKSREATTSPPGPLGFDGLQTLLFDAWLHPNGTEAMSILVLKATTSIHPALAPICYGKSRAKHRFKISDVRIGPWIREHSMWWPA
jgi:hypothetical protein